jgi:hypothetical protein
MQSDAWDRWKNSSRLFKWTVVGLLFIIIVLIVSLVPASYSYVEWNEYALKRDTTTNKVDYHEVYGNGRYFWGLGYGPVTFKNTATTVDFSGDNALSIFSSGGLELLIECSFQYQVIKVR